MPLTSVANHPGRERKVVFAVPLMFTDKIRTGRGRPTHREVRLVTKDTEIVLAQTSCSIRDIDFSSVSRVVCM